MGKPQGSAAGARARPRSRICFSNVALKSISGVGRRHSGRTRARAPGTSVDPKASVGQGDDRQQLRRPPGVWWMSTALGRLSRSLCVLRNRPAEARRRPNSLAQVVSGPAAFVRQPTPRRLRRDAAQAGGLPCAPRCALAREVSEIGSEPTSRPSATHKVGGHGKAGYERRGGRPSARPPASPARPRTPLRTPPPRPGRRSPGGHVAAGAAALRAAGTSEGCDNSKYSASEQIRQESARASLAGLLYWGSRSKRSCSLRPQSSKPGLATRVATAVVALVLSTRPIHAAQGHRW